MIVVTGAARFIGIGLNPMIERIQSCEVEGWLQQNIAPAFDPYKANSSRAVSAAKVRATLGMEHKAVSKK